MSDNKCPQCGCSILTVNDVLDKVDKITGLSTPRGEVKPPFVKPRIHISNQHVSGSKQCLRNQLAAKEKEYRQTVEDLNHAAKMNGKLEKKLAAKDEENEKLWSLFESDSLDKSIEKVEQELKQNGIAGLSFKKAGELFKKIADLHQENAALQAKLDAR